MEATELKFIFNKKLTDRIHKEESHYGGVLPPLADYYAVVTAVQGNGVPVCELLVDKRTNMLVTELGLGHPADVKLQMLRIAEQFNES